MLLLEYRQKNFELSTLSLLELCKLSCCYFPHKQQKQQQQQSLSMPPVTGDVDPSDYIVTDLSSTTSVHGPGKTAGMTDIFQVQLILMGVLFLVIFLLCSVCCCFGSLAVTCHLCCISTNLVRIIRKQADTAPPPPQAQVEVGAGDVSVKVPGDKSGKKSAKKTGKKSKKSGKA